MAENKIRVERGNVVLYVYEEERRHYLQLGYNVTDDNGNIIEESVPRDLGTLQRYYVESKKKIADLEAKVAELESGKSAKPADVLGEDAKAPAKRGRKKAE